MAVDVEALKEALRDLARETVEFAGHEFDARASARAPVRTGDLLRSIEAGEVGESGDTFHVEITCDVPYSLYQDEGTSRGVPPTGFWSDTIAEADDIWRALGAG
jgi:hypothetical protein